MPTINQLSAVDSLSAGDLVAVYDQSNGDARKASMSAVSSFVQSQITSRDNSVTQYAAPNATGFSVQVNNNSNNTWLILTPTGGFAAGTLVLPAVANVLDHQELLVSCTQSVTTLTINGNGATVVGAPTTLAANAFFRLRHDIITHNWYRVG